MKRISAEEHVRRAAVEMRLASERLESARAFLIGSGADYSAVADASAKLYAVVLAAAWARADLHAALDQIGREDRPSPCPCASESSACDRAGS